MRKEIKIFNVFNLHHILIIFSSMETLEMREKFMRNIYTNKNMLIQKTSLCFFNFFNELQVPLFSHYIMLRIKRFKASMSPQKFNPNADHNRNKTPNHPHKLFFMQHIK